MKPTKPPFELQSRRTSNKPRMSVAGHLHKRARGKYIKASSAEVGKFYVSVMVNGTRRLHCLNTYDMAEAKVRMAEVLAGKRLNIGNENYLKNLIRLGEWAKAQLGMGTVGEVSAIKDAWEVYVLSRRRPASGPKTLNDYKARWLQFSRWCASRGIKTLRDVNPQVAEEYVRHMETPAKVTVKYGKNKDTGRVVARGAATVNTHIQLLRLVYRVVDPAWPNPWVGVSSVLEKSVVPYRRLDLDEVRRLVDAADGEYKTLLLIGYTTGLRLVDAATLSWDKIDWRGRAITLTPRKTARRKGPRGEVSPPILDPLYAVLSGIPDKSRVGYVLPTIGPIYADRLKQAAVNRALRAIFKAAGVEDNRRGKASFHSLRVTWQSLNDESGTSRVITRAVLGHQGPAMSDTYSRIETDAARQAICQAIPDLW